LSFEPNFRHARKCNIESRHRLLPPFLKGGSGGICSAGRKDFPVTALFNILPDSTKAARTTVQAFKPTESIGCNPRLRKGKEIYVDKLSEITGQEIALRPIGYIRSPIAGKMDAPLMGSDAEVVGELVIDLSYRDALVGLEPGKKITILYWMHEADRTTIQVHPRRDKSRPLRGVFSTRSPDRPNPIALDTVEILEINGTVLRVRGIDAINETPLLDIKSSA